MRPRASPVSSVAATVPSATASIFSATIRSDSLGLAPAGSVMAARAASVRNATTTGDSCTISLQASPKDMRLRQVEVMAL